HKKPRAAALIAFFSAGCILKTSMALRLCIAIILAIQVRTLPQFDILRPNRDHGARSGLAASQNRTWARAVSGRQALCFSPPIDGPRQPAALAQHSPAAPARAVGRRLPRPFLFFASGLAVHFALNCR